MPPSRRFDPAALRAALTAQREVLAAAAVTSGSAIGGDDDAQQLIDAVAMGIERGVAAAPAALRIVVRLLVDRLAGAHPGRSVEVRVPPYAAVQCIPGPRHTRGTPPNVVETDPATFIGLACGFVGWDEAVRTGRVRASGERAMLRDFLPLDVPLRSDSGP